MTGVEGFSFTGGTNFFVPPGFAFAFNYSNNKKAKDSGGGTPDSVRTGFNPLRRLALFSLLCGGKLGHSRITSRCMGFL